MFKFMPVRLEKETEQAWIDWKDCRRKQLPPQATRLLEQPETKVVTFVHRAAHQGRVKVLQWRNEVQTLTWCWCGTFRKLCMSQFLHNNVTDWENHIESDHFRLPPEAIESLCFSLGSGIPVKPFFAWHSPAEKINTQKMLCSYLSI